MILHAVEEGLGSPPLVLLHGLFGSARNFGAVQRAFAQHRRTIALDLRNHGASPHAADMRYETMAADVLQTLERLDALPAILLGHSMGGKTAMQAALTRPEAGAALADLVPDAGMRSFLLQNLHLGAAPAWRIGIAEILAGFADIESWDAPADASYAGPTLFIAGAASDYIKPEHRPTIRLLFPRARLVTLKNAGHWLHADNPAGFVAVVAAFFDSH